MKRHLLIVDDEILISQNLELLLEDCCDKIFLAKNGIEALEILESNAVHTILSDINMPKKNGIELLKELHESNSKIPVILYSGRTDEELMIDAVRYNAFDFLDKPLLEGLEEVVKAALSSTTSSNDEKLETTSKPSHGNFTSEFRKFKSRYLE